MYKRQNEYRATFTCNTNSPQVTARITDDPYELYACTWDDAIDLSSKDILTITVDYSDNLEGEEEDDGSDTVDPNSVDWNSINYGIPDTPAEDVYKRQVYNGQTYTGDDLLRSEIWVPGETLIYTSGGQECIFLAMPGGAPGQVDPFALIKN